MQELQPFLADHPFLRGISPAKLNEIAKCARVEQYDTNEYLFRQGEEAHQCFLIRSGHVAVQISDPRHGSIEVQEFGEPGVLGWSWLVPPYRWCFEARALEPTEAIVLDARCTMDLCERDHDFGYELMKRFTAVFAQRLHAARIQLVDAYANRP